MDFILEEVELKAEPGTQDEDEDSVPPPWKSIPDLKFVLKLESVENVPSDEEFQMNLQAETSSISGNVKSFDPTVHHVDLDLSDMFLIKKTIKMEPTDVEMNSVDPLALPESNASAAETRNQPQGKKQHKCDVCEKPFAYKSGLTQHELKHTGEKPHTCEICGRKFSCRNNLYAHQMTHTGEKPYACDICGSKFGCATNLNVHKMRHTGYKPHSCNECGKDFLRMSDLTRHKVVHTKEKKYSCDVCGKNFASTYYVKRHTMRVHNSFKQVSVNTPRI